MTEDKEGLPKPQDTKRPCPTCGTFPRLLHSMLDVRRKEIVRLYQCQCGERIWDD